MPEQKPSACRRQHAVLLAALMVVLLVFAACGVGGSKPAPGAAPPTSIQAPSSSTQAPAPSQTGQPTPASATPLAPTPIPPTSAAAITRLPATQSPQPTATSKPGAGRFASPDELDSYRMKTVMWSTDEDRSTGTTILMEWVKSPFARHTVMGETEIITIGDTNWVKMMGRWVQQSSSPQQTQSQSDQLVRQIEDRMTYKETGRETVNGVACRKYSYSGEGTVQVAEGAMQGDYTVSAQGEAWVADQPPLPQVAIRNYGESTMKAMGSSKRNLDVAMSSEVDIYDINQPISIQPPEGEVITAPAPPGTRTPIAVYSPSPSAAATRTPVPSAASPGATRTPAVTPTSGASGEWTDDITFDLGLDRNWYGEPGVDATISTNARQGYLRFEAGSGNDMFPGNNFDAPTRWRVVSGDVLAETVVEFEPTEDYQGAGLFYWQDEDNFVRLERCFGGLGGIAGGICLLRVQDAQSEVIVSPVDVPTAATRVGLRLQRMGNQFSAWWADATAGPATEWQPLGSFEMTLTPSQQPAGVGFRVGLLLVVDQGAAAINADFDYYRARTP